MTTMPTRDQELSAFLVTIGATLIVDFASYNITSPEAIALDNLATGFRSALQVTSAPSTRTSATIAAKDVARADALAAIRPVLQLINADPTISEQDKGNLGLTARSLLRTRTAPPSMAPSLGLSEGTPLNTKLTYTAAGTFGKSKPFSVIGVQVFRTMGATVSTNPEASTYVGQFTKSPFVVPHLNANVGDICTFWAKFVTVTGRGAEAQQSSFSAPLTVTLG